MNFVDLRKKKKKKDEGDDIYIWVDVGLGVVSIILIVAIIITIKKKEILISMRKIWNHFNLSMQKIKLKIKYILFNYFVNKRYFKI